MLNKNASLNDSFTAKQNSDWIITFLHNSIILVKSKVKDDGWLFTITVRGLYSFLFLSFATNLQLWYPEFLHLITSFHSQPLAAKCLWGETRNPVWLLKAPPLVGEHKQLLKRRDHLRYSPLPATCDGVNVTSLPEPLNSRQTCQAGC